MASQALRFGLLVGSLLGGCDKLALSEHLDPMALPVAPGGSNTLDASTGFVPTDAGLGNHGDAAVAGACSFPVDVNAPFTKTALLTSVSQCTMQQLCEFDALAEDLQTKLSTYASAPSADTLAIARNAWYQTLQKWQVLELFQIGPAASLMDPGGQALRNEIYAFPYANRCAMEENLYDQTYLGPMFATAPSSARGFGALEYMLFFGDTTNGCTAVNRLNAKKLWATLSAEEIAARKAAYAGAVGRDLRAKSAALLSAWSASEGNFMSQLSTAGHGSTVYASEQAALNAVSNALYYLEQDVKLWKVGRPAALTGCSDGCRSYAESQYARISSDDVRTNLKAFRLIFQGCGENNAGLGFDDWLRAVGMGSIADEMLAALDAVDAAMVGFDLNAAFDQDPARVGPVYDAFKAVTDPFKTDMMTALDLSPPMELVGDND